MRWIGVLSMSMLAAGSCGFLAQASHAGEIREFLDHPNYRRAALQRISLRWSTMP